MPKSKLSIVQSHKYQLRPRQKRSEEVCTKKNTVKETSRDKPKDNTDKQETGSGQNRRDHFLNFLKCQRACHLLDVGFGKKLIPDESWYWPQIELNEVIPQNEDPEEYVGQLREHAAERLKLLVKYLRETYNYCFWCKISFDSKDEFQKYCPGLYKEH